MCRKVAVVVFMFLLALPCASQAGLFSKAKAKAKSVGSTVSNTSLSDAAGHVQSGASSVGHTVSSTTLGDVAEHANSGAEKINSAERNVVGTVIQTQGNAISAAGNTIGKGASNLGGKIKGSGH